MNVDDFKDPKLQESLRNASNPQELLKIAKDAGLELSDEQLEAVSGGNWSCWDIKGCTDVCSKYDAEWMHECWRYKRSTGPVECNLLSS